MIEEEGGRETEPSATEAAVGASRGADDAAKHRCCRDLDELNNEFDAFLYAVSHDFGAPIRSIQGFSSILLDQYSAELDEKGRDYLSRMQTAAQKIEQMVDDLLRISRLARVPMRLEELDLSGIARGIADRLGKSAPERSVQFIMTENIRASGDRTLLAKALENLLGNSWKFTKNKEHAVIEFGVLQDGTERVYFVKDNGVGFSTANAANRLFKPFQKLHKVSEYPGSGTGLAEVSRIIRRSGGKIWSESEAGEGATFFFTLA